MITWLASYPKSGNTWVRLLLNAYLNRSNDINSIEVAMSDTQQYFYRSVSPKQDISHTESFLLRPAALLHMTECYGECMLKTHNSNAIIQGVQLIPRALTSKAVYVVRDPRDVAISVAGHFGLSLDDAITFINDQHRAVEKAVGLHLLSDWSGNVLSWAKTTDFPVLVVRYEDLLTDTTAALERILRFTNIEPDHERMSMAVSFTEFSKLQKIEQDHGFNEKSSCQDKFFKNGCSTWRETLTQEQVARIESQHSEAMELMGYRLASE